MVLEAVDLLLVLEVVGGNLVEVGLHVVFQGGVVDAGEDLLQHKVLYFFILDDEFGVGFHDGVFDELPTQSFHVVVFVVLLNVLGGNLALAVVHDPTFHEGIGQVEFHGGHQFVNHLVEEDGVGLGLMLLLHLGFDGLLESVEVLDFFVGEDFLEEFLVQLGFLVADGVVDDDIEVAASRGVVAQNLGGFLFGTEHLGEVDDELSAHFLVDEFLSLGLVLDLAHVEVDTVFLEAAFHFLAVFGFAHLDFEAVVFTDGLGVAGVGIALQEVFNDFVHFLVSGDDMIEIDHRVGEVDVDFGTQGGLKIEVHVVFLLKVGRLL